MANGLSSSLEFSCVDKSAQGFSTDFFAHKQLTQRIWNISLHCLYIKSMFATISTYMLSNVQGSITEKNECFPLKKKFIVEMSPID